jgi:Ca-activated chloride channel family protein
MDLDGWPFAFLLLLVPALLLLEAHAARRRRRALAFLVDAELLPRLVPSSPDRGRWLRHAALLGAVAALVIALAQPRWGTGGQETLLRGRDIVVVLDVSLSMLARDVVPNRLARAKVAVRSLVETLRREGGHRLALLTFAGRTDMQCPPTRDRELFLARLEAASVEDVAQRGSALGQALLQAVEQLGGADPAFTDLILISDGEDHGSEPLEAARLVAARGFALYTVGIGDPARPVPVPALQGGSDPAPLVYKGQTAQTQMRRGTMTAIAEAAGGVYVPLETGEPSLQQLYRERIAVKPRHEAQSSEKGALQHRFQLFLAVAVVLLAVEMLMRQAAGGTR